MDYLDIGSRPRRREPRRHCCNVKREKVMQRALHIAFTAVVSQHLHHCCIAMDGGQVHKAVPRRWMAWMALELSMHQEINQ
jgi:hypothetical protein